ncbi:hypothetical protein [Pseudobacteriovorax antillogorgiicola]|uniref:Tat (Twin-arginine translocation) pathway signal sequence n=1 Tax=Pseudobacteriovorax antillogorgiicola TaxID=1513793 RepID=A0A1Y6CTS7_9BACT|nr:hypothetical protein [Pseudobacteriovorax antillogorgiicola]TCS45407.1 hypothetical protein EDD56_12818 [Pseudobacteriovorax antillogorgiicola]SMF73957.1 hypothetical protein SAMN06296036_12818 [Pseudobacteriovorax antillogorgiicola]
MINKTISRRSLLKITGASLGVAAGSSKAFASASLEDDLCQAIFANVPGSVDDESNVRQFVKAFIKREKAKATKRDRLEEFVVVEYMTRDAQ